MILRTARNPCGRTLVEFRILGPVEVWAAGRRHDLGSPKEACVLAVLLLAAGRPVSPETLIDHVWGTDPPDKVRGSLWSYVTRLRRILAVGEEAPHLVLRSGLYVLEADPEVVDIHRFRRLRAQARAIAESGDNERAAELLREADRLWRGEPLAGLTGDWARHTRAVLEQERLAATMDRAVVELALGNAADLAGELSELVSQHPFVESIVEYLMVALYRSGRQAEALDAYRQARQRLIGELGAEPGPGLRDLHQRILQGDPGLAAPARSWTGRGASPNNLPRDIPNFTGRAEELGMLAEAIVSGRARTAVTVVAIDGMAGVGKSTLAIHTAHRLASQFPDGQIFLDLHAHDPYEEPVDPATGLDTLLRVIGAASGRASAAAEAGSHASGLEERAALWREQVANRRILLILDDAASRDQVRPLLPGTPGCLVLITSRRRLTGLAGSRSLSLDVLRPADAADLFARIVGPERGRDTDAVAEVVRLCGNMPLAIQVVASRLRHRPAWTAADVARRLSSTQNRLREMRGEELEVASSFELSYRYLSREQQSAFRQLGCYPGLDISLHAASAAGGLPVAETERVLDGLLDYHLLEEPVHGRFRCHDLIRDYSRELAMREDTESLRRSVTHHLLDYYLHKADGADRILYPRRRRPDLVIAYVPAGPAITGQREALEWLEAERPNLLSAIQYAASHGFQQHATMLPHVVAQFLETGGYWQDAAVAHGCALEAWQAAGDRRGEAQAHTDLCLPRLRAGHFEDALDHGRKALAIFRALGDRRGEADALDRLGLVNWHSARYQDALTQFEESLVIHRRVGDRYGEAEALGHSGIGYWHIGRYDLAVSKFERALQLYRGVGDIRGEGMMLNNIGDVEQRLGAYDDALSHYQQALPIAHEAGRQAEAVLLNNIGNVCQQTGRHEDALGYFRQAFAIYHDIGDRRCEADTLNNIGTTYRRMGRDDESLIHHERALAIARTLTEDYEAAQALRGLGDTYCQMGRHNMALGRYRDALVLSRRIGDPYEEACALDGLGNALLRTEGETAAWEHWRQALSIFERIGVPEADTVRLRLGLPGPAGT
jgi:tetratricopeptide (TPR) repeat protein/DNA-binding SARP family transcriptional activator